MKNKTIDPIKFPRGLDSWLETHYQIVEFMGYNQSRYENAALKHKGMDIIDDLDGQCAKQEFAEDLTTNFETKHKDSDFSDTEKFANFFETIDEFLDEALKS